MRSAFSLSCALFAVGSQASQLRNMSAESEPDTTMYEPLTIKKWPGKLLQIDSVSCNKTVFQGYPSDHFDARYVRDNEVILSNGCVKIERWFPITDELQCSGLRDKSEPTV